MLGRVLRKMNSSLPGWIISSLQFALLTVMGNRKIGLARLKLRPGGPGW